MSALPRPDLPPGPQRDLVDALHDLHHRAGWPSLRAMAKQAGCSHTTVSKVFSSPQLPAWGNVELLVEAMGGDVEEARRLWLVASTSAETNPVPAAPIAGRRPELATVCRHLESGSGLLLVVGEAGIGKTALVVAARDLSATRVAVPSGHCLPLSTEVPLLPLVDLLRGCLDLDTGQWRAAVLGDLSSYVLRTLARLLPELDDGSEHAETQVSQQPVSTAVAATVDAVRRRRPLALLVEDLHWADPATLDVLEHLVAVGLPVPLVATFRTDDPHAATGPAAWSARIRRHASTRTLELGPLSQDETRDQLTLLLSRSPEAATVDRVFARTLGHPLFTEHLADHDRGELPTLLRDVLDTRTAGLSGPALEVAGALAVAERPLTVEVLREVCDPATDVDAALDELDGARLVAVADAAAVALRHPLLSEAVRARLLPGRRIRVHARLAAELGRNGSGIAGEVARHWRAAGDRGHELDWQIRAAHAARTRFAAREELNAWQRVLDLWPAGRATAGSENTPLAEAYVRAMRGAERVPDIEAGTRIARAAGAAELPPDGRAAVLVRTGDWWLAFDEPELGLAQLDEAVSLSSGPALAEALMVRAQNWSGLGRWDDGSADLDTALDLLPAVSDPELAGRVLGASASQRAVEGRYDDARTLLDRARTAPGLRDDPIRTVRLAAEETDVMLLAGAPLAEVRAIAEPALAEAARLGMESTFPKFVRRNLVEACLRAGDVPAADALLQPYTSITDTPVNQRLRCYLAAVEVRRGELDLVRRLLASSGRPPLSVGHVEETARYADAELWVGRAEEARAHLTAALEFLLPTDGARAAAPVLVAAARATADCLGTDQARAPAARRLRELLAGAADDPFGPRAVGVQVRAYAAAWGAELNRSNHSSTVVDWASAAAEWDALGWPHDAAYCRWRGAQVAIAQGEGTVAGRLLTRAARDARAHVPLGEAITATAGYARRS